MGYKLIIPGNLGCGFFCCCIDTLQRIVNYLNEEHEVPELIDFTEGFPNFKSSPEKNVFYKFFEVKDIEIKFKDPINMSWEHAFAPFNIINFEHCSPLVTKYFSPSKAVESYIQYLIEKYKIDFENTAYILYRGNDKHKETKIAPYEEFIEKAKELYNLNPNLRFLVQTDEIEFREAFASNLNNSFFFEEIPAIHRDPEKVVHKTIDISEVEEFGIKILASIISGSKCKYLITHTGNVGLWAALYRGNVENLQQYLNGEWIK